MDQKSFLASPSSSVESSCFDCWSVLEENLSGSPWRIPCSSPRSGLSRIKVDVLRRWSPPQILTVPSATGNIKLSPFIGVNTSNALSLRAWSSDASICSNSSMSAMSRSPFQIPPACNAYPMNFPDKTLGPNWCSLHWSLAEIGWYSTIVPKCNNWAIKWNSEPRFLRVSIHQTRDLVCFADSSNTPWNPRTVQCPDLIATIQQRCLPWLCALLFPQSH